MDMCVLYALFYFCSVLQLFVLMYMIACFLPQMKTFQNIARFLACPILMFINLFVRNSVLWSPRVDFTPIVAVLFLQFIQQLLPIS